MSFAVNLPFLSRMLVLKRLMSGLPSVQGPVAAAIKDTLIKRLQPAHLEGQFCLVFPPYHLSLLNPRHP